MSSAIRPRSPISAPMSWDKHRTLMAAWSAFLAGDNQCLNRAAAFGGT